jgi:hypothetical protein
MKPTEGIYYVVRFPNGWHVMPCRFDEEGEMSHSSYWRHWGLAAVIANEWKTVKFTNLKAMTEDDLESLMYALPRGRVTKVGSKFIIYHGNDLQPWMKVTKRQIEQAFGVTGSCRWVMDDHEHCQLADKEELRRLLNLKEDWPAV